jgi:hypothetical protein
MKKYFLPVGIVFFLLISFINFSKNKEMAHKLSNMEVDIFNIQASVDERDDYAVLLDPSSLGKYQQIGTQSGGSFLISLEDIQPFLDGYKLIFMIGNLNYADYNGFELKLKYGKRLEKLKSKKGEFISIDDFTKRYEEWENKLKNKEESFMLVLKRGYWTKVEIILASTKPDELGYMKLEMETDSIVLYRD